MGRSSTMRIALALVGLLACRATSGRPRKWRRAYSRPGGYTLVCYDSDVTPAMINSYRASHNRSICGGHTMQFIRIAIVSLIAIAVCSGPVLAKPAKCPAFNVKGDRPLDAVAIPSTGLCKVQTKAGFQFPDPTCTPGAVNPALTNAILKNKNFRTGCERDQAIVCDQEKDDLRLVCNHQAGRQSRAA